MKNQFITIEEAIQNGNSGNNQNIKADFISKHVHANINQMVEYIINKSYEDSDAPFSYEDIENYYSYPEATVNVVGESLIFEGGSEADKDIFIENFDRMIEESETLLSNEEISEETHERNISLIEEAKETFLEETEDQEQSEVYEWWLVSDYLFDKLNQKGHPVITGENIWGRCTTGQAILLDHVITVICAEMEILEGQRYEWKK